MISNQRMSTAMVVHTADSHMSKCEAMLVPTNSSAVVICDEGWFGLPWLSQHRQLHAHV
jgi:hypothetical protein